MPGRWQGRNRGVARAPPLPPCGQDGQKIQRNKGRGNTLCRRPILLEKVANMVPSWVARWSQDAQKIDPKIDHFFDASWDRFFICFWSIFFGSKMEPSWHQHRIKIGCQFRKAISCKNQVFPKGKAIVVDFGSQVGAKLEQTSKKKNGAKLDANK